MYMVVVHQCSESGLIVWSLADSQEDVVAQLQDLEEEDEGDAEEQTESPAESGDEGIGLQINRSEDRELSRDVLHSRCTSSPARSA